MAEQSPDQSLEQFLGDVLNDRISVIAPLADLPAWWRDAPPEEPDPDRPGFATREALLHLYVHMSDTEAWAGEGLRALLRYLLEREEKPPPLLVAWAVKRCAYGDPSPKRGRPVKVDRTTGLWRFSRFFGFTDTLMRLPSASSQNSWAAKTRPSTPSFARTKKESHAGSRRQRSSCAGNNSGHFFIVTIPGARRYPPFQ